MQTFPFMLSVSVAGRTNGKMNRSDMQDSGKRKKLYPMP